MEYNQQLDITGVAWRGDEGRTKMTTGRAKPFVYLFFSAMACLCWECPVIAAAGAVPVHVVRTDLKSLIRAAADAPVQFAVLVPHTAATTNSGKWSSADGHATWQYAVDIPTAVSISFHAIESSLPESAVLVVRGAKTTARYRARDLHRGEIWSRIQPGEALQFTLTVAAADRSKVALKIVSLQAGYRSLGAGVQDHPYYRQLKAQLNQAPGSAACVTNYECQVTTSNTPSGQATVALVVENLYQCTGSLINDVPGDNTPYVLTARHCESGQLGGGNPGAASAVVVYWDATTTCGAALGSIYDANILTQTGAQTIVEQQDAWLIQLDGNPVVKDAQFTGFDAGGGAVQGGYTVHHAEGYNKQYTGWYGTAYAVEASGVLGTTYVSDFWETVNQLGNIGPGASGSGLFDQNNHLVGLLSLGRTTSDPSGYGACPVNPLSAPNGTNGVGDFTALSAVWNSTVDTTSSTGSKTLKSVLDPGDTGTLVVASAPAAYISLSASSETLSTGQQLTLSWDAPNGTQCTAGGGVSGDGWSGTLAILGTKSLTETNANFVTYTLSCAYNGGRTAKSSVTVSWLGPTPVVQFNASATVWTTTPATLSWSSNIGPCSITGGSLALTNLARSGTTTTTQSSVGDVSYTLTCGPENQVVSAIAMVSYVTPSLVLNANGTDRLLGQTFFLVWSTAATSCTPSGGAPNDGWSNTQFTGFYATSGEPFYPTVTTPGSYTYTLTCSSGSLSVRQSVAVTFENNAPYATASLSSTSVAFSNSPADYVTLSWKSNLSSCGLMSSPGIPANGSNESYPQGAVTINPYQSGTYQLWVDCFTALNPESVAAKSSTLTLTVTPPPPPTPTITFFPATVAAGQTFNVSWSAAYATQCLLTGGIPGGFWGGSVQYVPTPGSATESGPAGQYTFAITCASIDPGSPPASTQARLSILQLSASLESSATSVTIGDSFTLTWSSVGATACMASGGGANGNSWSGSLAASGSATQTAAVAGTFIYSLICSEGTASTAPKQATITVSQASTGGGSSNSSRGGGGGLGLLELGSLAALLGLSRSRTPRDRRHQRRRAATAMG
jgi:lysyl endopeptidase